MTALASTPRAAGTKSAPASLARDRPANPSPNDSDRKKIEAAQTPRAAKATPPRNASRAAARTDPSALLASLAFAAAVTAVLLYGWWTSDEGRLTPESGLGYGLGIAGGSAMLLLLMYPLRKRCTGLHRLGSVAGWFRIHMMLGIVGPALILLHSNFKLGSLNSNVALFAMLTVAGSGLVGRYFYTRIHLGLYGRRMEIAELQANVETLKDAMHGGFALPAAFFAELDAHAKRGTPGGRGAMASLLAVLMLKLGSAGARARLLGMAERQVRTEGKRLGWSWLARRRQIRRLRTLLGQYFKAVDRAAAFAFYERIFALWHVLHLPLFAILVFAAIVHIVAVHLY